MGGAEAKGRTALSAAPEKAESFGSSHSFETAQHLAVGRSEIRALPQASWQHADAIMLAASRMMAAGWTSGSTDPPGRAEPPEASWSLEGVDWGAAKMGTFTLLRFRSGNWTKSCRATGNVSKNVPCSTCSTCSTCSVNGDDEQGLWQHRGL